MLTVGDIYVLNRALDGEDIKGMPSFQYFQELKAREYIIENIKESLITKGYLETANTLSRKGVKTLHNMELFKQAEKYIVIQDITIALVGKDQGMLLKEGSTSYEYQFLLIDSSNLKEKIIEKYDFLKLDQVKEVDSEKKVIAALPYEVCQMYYLNAKAGFSLKINQKEGQTFELFYQHKEKFYIYNCISRELQQCSLYKMLDLLKTRLGPERGEKNHVYS